MAKNTLTPLKRTLLILQKYEGRDRTKEGAPGRLQFTECVNFDRHSISVSAEWIRREREEWGGKARSFVGIEELDADMCCALFGELKCEDCPLCENMNGTSGFWPK